MTSVSYSTRLADFFRSYIPLRRKSNSIRTGYAAAYPQVKQYHRQQSNLLSCIPLCYKSKQNSSIKGCASFARFGTYQEGDTEDDC
ncbi:unnamed protein product [Adineta steineri]|uniref:Uncharacterized protein n=1 Tax=Adineta steineri TaxID=433720 RepID=A0A818NVE0_9BILA|nr:unnamed protein product [Adineta steineri]CAF1019236.1 unnamed protein product [Adineta steineri]CAF3610970.1 unnamed protein product [Adineta steineri]CAF3628134.1 unnamed protein product [Adineta steineri]